MTDSTPRSKRISLMISECERRIDYNRVDLQRRADRIASAAADACKPGRSLNSSGELQSRGVDFDLLVKEICMYEQQLRDLKYIEEGRCS